MLHFAKCKIYFTSKFNAILHECAELDPERPRNYKSPGRYLKNVAGFFLLFFRAIYCVLVFGAFPLYYIFTSCRFSHGTC